MASSGSFNQYVADSFGLVCNWTATKKPNANSSDIKVDVYLRCYNIDVGERNYNNVTINGSSKTYTTAAIRYSGSAEWHNVYLTSYTVNVKHNADGTKNNVNLSASWKFSANYTSVAGNTSYVGQITASTTVNLDSITTYTLTTSAGSGSSITVNRTSSGFGATGSISSGTRLYHGDTLKITFTSGANYRIITRTVNGSAFTSGGTYTVAGNVSVASTTREIYVSGVGATDANVGAISTITVTKHNSSYYHSLQYSFGGLSGYITSSGGVQGSLVKFSNSSIPFSIPTSFYQQIPSSRVGTCTITCSTYSSEGSATVLGEPTQCTFTVTATGSPTVSGSVVDTNNTTVALTGNSSVLVRHKSTAVATISATAINSASISAKSINNTAVSGNTKTFAGVFLNSFIFKATDSRGYSTTTTVNPSVVEYVQLTINPEIYRPTPTGNEFKMRFTGDYFNGSFGTQSGAQANTLTIKYRYQLATGGEPWSNWITINPSQYTIGSNTYNTTDDISLGNGFNYQEPYIFQVEAVDGTALTPLTTITKTIRKEKGLPIFDWGEDDFEFHVPVKIKGINVIGHVTDLADEDLNDLTEDVTYSGVYIQRNSSYATALRNYPTNYAGVLHVVNGIGGAQKYQWYTPIIHDDTSIGRKGLYVRTKYDGAWHEWQYIPSTKLYEEDVSENTSEGVSEFTWNIRESGDGFAECWANNVVLSAVTTNAGSFLSSYREVTLPFSSVDGTEVVSVTSRHFAFSCQSAWVTHPSTGNPKVRFYLSSNYAISTATDVGVSIHVTCKL